MFGPEFAMLRTPRPVWDRLGRNSSLKGFPQKDSPPATRKADERGRNTEEGERYRSTRPEKTAKTCENMSLFGCTFHAAQKYVVIFS